jgi:putative DNA primase/helicase
MSKAFIEFEQALLAHGLEPGEIAPDGVLRRCSSNGSGQDKAGYYALFDNGRGVLGGFFGDWRTGIKEAWISAKAKDLSKKDREEFKARIEAARSQAQEERHKEHKAAAAKGLKIWEAATEAMDEHPYLKTKGVPALGLRVSKRGQLLIPVMDTCGKLLSLQFIDAEPDEKGKFGKKFLTGGQVGGRYFTITGKREVFYICEGYATGASIHQATGQTVVCAFNAGNLKPVALAVRTRHPKAGLVIAADNDQWTDGNPGKAKAMEAAKEAKALFALPRFKDESSRPTDFNDLARLEGMEAVQMQLLAARGPENKPDTLHFPFDIRPDGVYYREEDKDGGVTPVRICSPLEVVAVTHNEHHEQWGRLLKVTDLAGHLHLWAMPLRMTRGGREDFLEELCDMGLKPVPGRKSGDRIRLFISEHPTTEMLLCADRIGWHGESFVLPERTFSPSGRSGRIVFQGEARTHNFRTKGTLAEWQEQIGRYAVGNSRLALALSIAMAGPLLHLLGGESGGFHFVGDTSAGKSTILLAAGSVCGGGLDGYHKQWRSTDNALEAIASAHCDTLLCLDEIGQCDGRVVAETSYMLANGQGKQRLSKGAALKRAYTWRLVFLSTGEISCADKIRESGGRMKAGQEIRVLDLPAVPANGLGVFETLHGFSSGAALADHLTTAARRVYGHPLPTFLTRLVSEAGDIRLTWDPFLAKFLAKTCPDGAPHAVQRACKRFALVAMAGALATAWGVFPWPDNQATDAAGICFRDWIQARGGAASMDAIHGIEQVRAFIMAHGSSRFELVDGGDTQKVVGRAGFKRRNNAGEWVYLISPDVFKNEVCAGLNMKTVCQALRDMGALLSENGRALFQFRAEGEKRRFYAVNEKALFPDESLGWDEN